MAKYFLGSVGTAEAFRLVNGEPAIAFVSKTLTDSGINISNTKDDIRGGTNAPIQFSFYHDANVEVTLTDIVFKPEYVEAQLGVKFEAEAESYAMLNTADSGSGATVAAGSITLDADHEVLELPFGCGKSGRYAWFAESGTDNWKLAAVTKSGTETITYVISDASIEAAKNYCVRYLGRNEAARVATITSSMVPEELFLIITAPIFAGDACAASESGLAGEIVFEIPRFKLAGAQDFAMAMSSNQTMSLSGTALAVEDGCMVNGSKLLRIREVILNRKLYDGAVAVYSDGATTPSYWFVYENGTVAPINASSGYTVTVASNTASIKAQGSDTVLVSLPVITD